MSACDAGRYMVGLLDFVIDGSVYSADLADMTLKKSDILITDSEGNEVTEVEENQELTFYTPGIFVIR